MKLLSKYLLIISLFLILSAILRGLLGVETYCNIYLRFLLNTIIYLSVITLFFNERKMRNESLEFGILFQYVFVFLSFGFILNQLMTYAIVHLVDESFIEIIDKYSFDLGLRIESLFGQSPVERAKSIAFHEVDTIGDYAIVDFLISCSAYIFVCAIPLSLILVYLFRLVDRWISRFRDGSLPV